MSRRIIMEKTGKRVHLILFAIRDETPDRTDESKFDTYVKGIDVLVEIIEFRVGLVVDQIV